MHALQIQRHSWLRHWLVLGVLALSSLGLFAQNTPTSRYDTVAEMVQARIPASANTKITALVAGRLTVNDGGGGTFFYDPSSSADTNLGTIFKPKDSGGRWIRQYTDTLQLNWFGVDTGGVKDSSTNIQNAIDTSVDGNTLIFNKASSFFKVDSQIVLNKNITLKGELGSWIKLPDDSQLLTRTNNYILKVTATNVVIDGLFIDGNARGNPDYNSSLYVSGIPIYTSPVSSGAVYTIQNCQIYDSPFTSIEVNGQNASNLISKATVLNNTITKGRRDAIPVLFVESGQVSGNTIIDNEQHAIHVYTVSSGVTVYGNTIRNSLAGSNMAGIMVGHPSYPNSVENVSVFGNNITNLFYSGQNIPTGIHVRDGAENVSVTGNVVNGGQNNLIITSMSHNVNASGNTFINSSDYGIYVAQAWDVSLTGNTVHNSGLLSDDTYDGIILTETTNSLLALNQIRKADSGNQSRYGIRLDTSSVSNRVYGNDLTFSGKTGFLLNAGKDNEIVLNTPVASVFGTEQGSAAEVSLRSTNGFNRDVVFYTGNLPRWVFRANSSSESGANSGSNLQFIRRADDGSNLGSVLTLYRTGTVDLNGTLNTSVNFTVGNGVYAGSGTPEGSVTANVGSIYLRSNGSVGTSLYIKQSGAGDTGWSAVTTSVSIPVNIGAACSDETTPVTSGAGKVTFRSPSAFTLTGVRASLTTAQSSGSIFTVNIKQNGASVLSTKITIDNGATTSTTATTPPVISTSAITDDSVITVDVDQVGDGTATGLKVWLIGTR